MSKHVDNKIFVIRYKDSNKYVKNVGGRPIYVNEHGFPTVDVGNAGMYSKSSDAFKQAVFWHLDKETIVQEV